MTNHFRFTPWGRVSGWKGGTACDLADATTWTIEVGGGLDVVKFENLDPADRETRRLEYALDIAFKRGDWSARAEIRNALGVTERG